MGMKPITKVSSAHNQKSWWAMNRRINNPNTRVFPEEVSDALTLFVRRA